ncbi:hypothetical protein BGW36DRAFT_375548 [Talaromyces proteolyticus]|uniref:Cytochrome c oxidase assembly factor 3 n=1 Tax=Talaromyces proteolyticus TaxID=1131652 RepID=A0AAD4L1B4_9EURO|nr:uncharacterized protein BGW36DRAFT_375548 [Talaromyces proteolyticus]KAH8701084.1 hypothetical protein BGW36DRAFT_375548 [Talaromyces proteolyticus]
MWLIPFFSDFSISNYQLQTSPVDSFSQKRILEGIEPRLKMPSGIFNSSYYGKDYRAGAALLRARRPYLVRNALTGLGLCVFTVGVYAFTIRAVGQEDFSDVVVPEASTVNSQQQK